ncbi:LysR family transcriptional regulator [Conexibacter woesei]|uniref:LysR family transcriptional regulator n=1 Tax=Conexibacter woesei TaxID=191495 RepID=UPI00047BB5C7|nr:LysR family transcriptional regulator [Conexibacter woesei]
MRHLAALGAVHEERSFRGAADRLGYVQSAVSQQISQLERLVGARLVDRERGHTPPVMLTEAGLVLLEHGATILAQLDAAQADLRLLSSGDEPRLHVGVLQSVAATLLPMTLMDLRASHPQIAVEVTEAGGDRDAFAAVEAGELDAAFAELPLADGPFESVEILVDPTILLVQASSARAAAGAPATRAELVEEPLIHIQGWPLLDSIEALLRAGGHEPEIALRADANATVQALVGAGCGAALLPALAVASDDQATVALPVDHLLPSRRLALYWHAGRKRPAVVNAFCEAVLRSAATLSPAGDEPSVHAR